MFSKILTLLYCFMIFVRPEDKSSYSIRLSILSQIRFFMDFRQRSSCKCVVIQGLTEAVYVELSVPTTFPPPRSTPVVAPSWLPTRPDGIRTGFRAQGAGEEEEGRVSVPLAEGRSRMGHLSKFR